MNLDEQLQSVLDSLTEEEKAEVAEPEPEAPKETRWTIRLWKGKIETYQCNKCGFDTHGKNALTTISSHYYWKHEMNIAVDRNGNPTVTPVTRPVKAVLYDGDNKLITEVPK